MYNIFSDQSYGTRCRYNEAIEARISRLPSKEGREVCTTRKVLWSAQYIRLSVNIDTFRSPIVCACIFFFFSFGSWILIAALGLWPVPFTSEPDSRKDKGQKKTLRRTQEQVIEPARGRWGMERDVKVKSDFPRCSQPCGEGSSVTKDDRTLWVRKRAGAWREAHPVQGHNAAHAATVVPSPSEDLVPFIEIRRIDCRDCATALAALSTVPRIYLTYRYVIWTSIFRNSFDIHNIIFVKFKRINWHNNVMLYN